MKYRILNLLRIFSSIASARFAAGITAAESGFLFHYRLDKVSLAL